MARRRRVRQFRDSAEIDEILAAYKASGQSQSAFARAHDLSPSSLSNWLRRPRRGRRPQSPRPALVPVHMIPPPSLRAPYEVQLANDRMVRVPPGFDADELRRLLSAVESPC